MVRMVSFPSSLGSGLMKSSATVSKRSSGTGRGVEDQLVWKCGFYCVDTQSTMGCMPSLGPGTCLASNRNHRGIHSFCQGQNG